MLALEVLGGLSRERDAAEMLRVVEAVQAKLTPTYGAGHPLVLRLDLVRAKLVGGTSGDRAAEVTELARIRTSLRSVLGEEDPLTVATDLQLARCEELRKDRGSPVAAYAGETGLHLGSSCAGVQGLRERYRDLRQMSFDYGVQIVTDSTLFLFTAAPFS